MTSVSASGAAAERNVDRVEAGAELEAARR